MEFVETWVACPHAVVLHKRESSCGVHRIFGRRWFAWHTLRIAGGAFSARLSKQAYATRATVAMGALGTVKEVVYQALAGEVCV